MKKRGLLVFYIMVTCLIIIGILSMHRVSNTEQNPIETVKKINNLDAIMGGPRPEPLLCLNADDIHVDMGSYLDINLSFSFLNNFIKSYQETCRDWIKDEESEYYGVAGQYISMQPIYSYDVYNNRLQDVVRYMFFDENLNSAGYVMFFIMNDGGIVNNIIFEVEDLVKNVFLETPDEEFILLQNSNYQIIIDSENEIISNVSDTREYQVLGNYYSILDQFDFGVSYSEIIDQDNLIWIDFRENDIQESINDEDFYTGGWDYLELQDDEKIRFIKEATEIFALPYLESKETVRSPIWENTIVTVYDKISLSNVEWYYVSIPVYDAPMDMKGWVLAEKTYDYSEETRDLLQSDVYIEIGTLVYEGDEFPEAWKEEELIETTYEQRGRIEERRDGFIKLLCTGGSTLWVREEELIYPEFP